MLEPATGQPAPCPNCGSLNVRWRERRWYDVVRTYMRYVVDKIANAVFGGNRVNNVGARFGARSDKLMLDAIEYSEERKIYEDRAGTMTAERFSKCHACGKHGEVFAQVDQLLGERAHLVQLEGDIDRNSGVVAHRITPDQVKRD